jgi:hypothetical protein
MTKTKSFDLPHDFQTWTNDGSDLPDWIDNSVLESRAPNGTLMIETPAGATRVHVNDVVIRHGDQLWTRPPAELHDFIQGLKAQAVPDHAAIGIGKVARFGNRSRAKSARKRRYPAPRGSMPSIEWIHIDRLAVDPSYQRSIANAVSLRLIASIAQNFDWRLCAPLIISRRPDGSLVIIDGQHRWAAAMERDDVPQLPCCVYSYDSPEVEARMFIMANRARKQINRLDDFHAALVAGDEDSLEIVRLVEDAGLKVTRNLAATMWQPGEIAFVTSISRALGKHGPAIVSGALTNLAEAFEGERLTYGTSIFLALVKILADPPAGFDPDHLVPALQTQPMSAWGENMRGLIGNDPRAEVVRGRLLAQLDQLHTEALAA